MELLVLANEGEGRITVTVAVAVLFGRAAPFGVALDPYKAELVLTPVLAFAVALPTTVTSNKSSVELLLVYVVGKLSPPLDAFRLTPLGRALVAGELPLAANRAEALMNWMPLGKTSAIAPL